MQNDEEQSQTLKSIRTAVWLIAWLLIAGLALAALGWLALSLDSGRHLPPPRF